MKGRKVKAEEKFNSNGEKGDASWRQMPQEGQLEPDTLRAGVWIQSAKGRAAGLVPGQEVSFHPTVWILPSLGTSRILFYQFRPIPFPSYPITARPSPPAHHTGRG